MIITSVTTSEMAKALCSIEVFTQFAFSTIVLAQYAEKSLPQIKTSAKKKATVQLMMTKSMNQLTQLNFAAALFVKIRR